MPPISDFEIIPFLLLFHSKWWLKQGASDPSKSHLYVAFGHKKRQDLSSLVFYISMYMGLNYVKPGEMLAVC